MSDVGDLFTEVNIIGKPDRKLAEAFASDNKTTAAEVEKRYAASGDLICGDRFAQAQVVLKNNLIITAAHALYRDDCDSAFKLSECKFSVVENGKKIFYEIGSQEGDGFRCPSPDPTQKQPKNTQDWAILKLKRPTGPAIKPYQLGDPPCADEKNPADVVRVGKSNDFGLRPQQSVIMAPKHYANCQVRHYICGVTKLLSTDCDSSHASSGSGTFVGGEEPKIVGMGSLLISTCPGDAKAKTGEFNQKCWSADDIAIAGAFKDQILKAAEEGPSGAPDLNQRPRAPSRRHLDL